MRAEASITIRAPAKQILQFVCDLERYRQADHKIATITQQPTVSPESPTALTRYSGRLRGVPTPPEWQIVHLEPWSRLTLRSKPGQWTNRFATFEGGFICDDLDDERCLVTHYEQFTWHPAVEPLAERALANWLQDDIEDEMQRLKTLIETEPTRRTSPS